MTVGLAAAVGTLVGRLVALRDATRALRLTVVDDLPSDTELMQVDELGNAVDDLVGWGSEALGEAAAAELAMAVHGDVGSGLRRLIASQERFNRFLDCWSGRLTTYRTLDELASLARERGGEWAGWVAMVRVGLDRSQVPLRGADAAYFACWKEVAELATPGSWPPIETVIDLADGQGEAEGPDRASGPRAE
jgi:hypothetical protein